MMGGLEILSASPSWIEDWSLGKEKTLYFTLPLKRRVFLNSFVEGYGLAGPAGFAHWQLSPRLSYHLETDPPLG